MIDSQEIADDFFATIPDELLIKMALYDWVSLKKVCIALTLDLQLLEEQEERKKIKN
jgi:hypothetical protein